MGQKGYPLTLVNIPSELNLMQELYQKNHYLAVLITSVRHYPDGERNVSFTTREIKNLARICTALNLELTVSSMKDFDCVELFWDMIDEARIITKEPHWSGYQSAVYAVCFFYNRLRLTDVFSEDFKEDEHSPYYLLGKDRLLQLLERPEIDRRTFFSMRTSPRRRRAIAILSYKSDYLRERVMQTVRKHRICDSNDSINVNIVEDFENWFLEPESIYGYEDFTAERLGEACRHINATWPNDIKAREYRYKFLFDVWGDVILDYPNHDFFEGSYLYNTEIVLNGRTASNLAKGYKLVPVGLHKEIPPYGLIQFVVAHDELRSASGKPYSHRRFDATTIKDLHWRQAVVNYAAHCIANGSRNYTSIMHLLQQFIEYKKTSKEPYRITGQDIIWIKMQIYHRDYIKTPTKSTIFNGIKSFFRYAREMGYISAEERDIKRIKSISARYVPDPHSLSMYDINALDEAFDKLASIGLHYRYSKIIFHIQLNSEARAGEICSVLVDSITFHPDGTCSVYEKIKNNGKRMMMREYNTCATDLFREAMDLSREIRQTCPVGGPKNCVFLYTNDIQAPNPFAIMDIGRYNKDLHEACGIANTGRRYSSGNVRDTTLTARKRFARRLGLTDLETGAFVGHVERTSTNSYIDMDFREVLRAARGINIGNKR